MAKAFSSFWLMALLAAATLPAAAQGEPRRLTVPETAAWGHAGTGMTLPPRVGGLVRSAIEDSSQDETDISATYIDRDEQVIGLVYIDRTGAGDLPLWFDRQVLTIMLPQTGAPAPVITGFTRPGASVASGLRAAMTDDEHNTHMRSTAVAIAPLAPGWLVKIRMGSPRLDPAALNERLTAFAAALHWPAETAGARVAVPIEPCPTPLQLREARIVRPEGSDVIMDSVLGTIRPEPGEPTGPPPVFCREPGATVEWGVYRADQSTDSYLIALYEAGLAIGVGDASGLSALLGQNGRHRFSVTLYERGATSSYPSFNRLPPPVQAWTLVRRGQPLSTTSGNNVSISTDALGH
jgi:hypothetical protein